MGHPSIQHNHHHQENGIHSNPLSIQQFIQFAHYKQFTCRARIKILKAFKNHIEVELFTLPLKKLQQ